MHYYRSGKVGISPQKVQVLDKTSPLNNLFFVSSFGTVFVPKCVRKARDGIILQTIVEIDNWVLSTGLIM